MTEYLKILLIEDDEDDYILTEELLDEVFGDQYKLEWVSTYDKAIEAVNANRHDICLVDYRLGIHTGLELIESVVTRGGDNAPFILLTGQNDRETDIAAMQAGATDYLVKQELTGPLVERSIRYAIKQKSVEKRLTSLAHYDPLTGLANRTLFHIKLQDGIANAKRSGNLLALLLLDLDHFKEINDTLGHPVGDALLQQVAKRLLDNSRETDTVTRLGGDEFAVIATHITLDKSVALVAKKLVKALAQPYQLDSELLQNSTSLGVALYPQHGEDQDSLLSHADLALYQAKNAGRNTFSFYDAQLDENMRKEKTLRQDLEAAIEQKQFELHLQPILTCNGRLNSAEGLLRWNHPKQGWIPPDHFIPIAESTGLIVPLGELVLEMACDYIKSWGTQNNKPATLAVNISPAQLTDQRLLQIIDAANIDPSLVEFELTENILIEATDQQVQLLSLLHSKGVNIAIDDFGMGYSSLSYLKQLPVTKLKIDRSFIRGVDSSDDQAAIVRAIIMLSHALGLKVVAEGVETQSQANLLLKEGCELLQGFLFAKPMPIDAFNRWTDKQG